MPRAVLTRSVTQSSRSSVYGPALRACLAARAACPCALTRGRPAVPRRPGTGRSRRTARRAALAPAVPRCPSSPADSAFSPQRAEPSEGSARTAPIAVDSVWEDVDALRADAAIGACTTRTRLFVCRSTRDELCCARGRCCPVCSQRSRRHSVARGLAGRWKVFHVGTLPTGTPPSTRRRMSACSRL
jgi:hypothetical protein